MAKRLIDTSLFDDPWFMDLSKDGKIMWIYLFTKCDHAGIIEINDKLCKFQTGIKDLPTVYKELGNRLIRVKEQYYFIPKFLYFQYPSFPNSKVKAQESAIEILKKFELFDEGNQRVIEPLANDYEYVYGNDYGNGNGRDTVKKNKETNKIIDIPEFEEFKLYAIEKKPKVDLGRLKYKYDAWVENGWKDGNDKKISNWKSKLLNTLPHIPEGQNNNNKPRLA